MDTTQVYLIIANYSITVLLELVTISYVPITHFTTKQLSLAVLPITWTAKVRRATTIVMTIFGKRRQQLRPPLQSQKRKGRKITMTNMKTKKNTTTRMSTKTMKTRRSAGDLNEEGTGGGRIGGSHLKHICTPVLCLFL